MSSLFERGNEAARHERAISSLSDGTGASLAKVRVLFTQEFSRLELGAKVRSYLSVLTASSVRAMLPKKGEPRPRLRAEKHQLETQELDAWEDEGGRPALPAS